MSKPLKTAQQITEGWRLFPDDISDGGLLGYQTKFDPSGKKALLHAVAGQNTTVYNGKISIREYGSELIGSDSIALTPIKTQGKFEKRDGTVLEFRTYDTVMEWRPPAATSWYTLATGFTAAKRFGYAALNVNADAVSYLYFCNAYESMYRWSGAYGSLSSVTGATIVLSGSTTLANLGFTATGSVILGGITYTYTGLSGQTFTGVTPDPTLGGHSASDPVAQTPITVADAPRGNILFVKDAALFVGGILYNAAGTYAPRQSELHRSKVGDATNWTVSSTAGDSKRQEFPEGGGPIIGVSQDEQAIYVLKSQCVVVLTISNTDVFSTGLLKAFDGKSQSTGATSARAICSGINGNYFLNQKNEFICISRLQYIDTPQASRISDPIEPTLKVAVADEAVAWSHAGRVFLSCKSSTDASTNDVVFVYDERIGQWDTPIIGWQVNDAVSVGTAIHWGSSLNPTSWTTISDKTDNTTTIGANWRSWQETFGKPHLQKVTDGAYVEGFIAENTTLTVSILFDEDGYNGQLTGTITGTDTGVIFNSTEFNVFGFSEFGAIQVGSNVAVSNLKKFRVYFMTPSNTEFFTVQWDFASDQEGANWEITRFGLRLVGVQPINKNYQRTLA